MSDDKTIVILKAAKELNIGIGTIVEFLNKKGFTVDSKPNTKLSGEMYNVLLSEFQGDKIVKEEANQIAIGKIRRDETEVTEKPAEIHPKAQKFENEEILIKNVQNHASPAPVEQPKAEVEEPKSPEPSPVKTEEEPSAVTGVKIVGKIDLSELGPKGRHSKKEEKAEPKAEKAKEEKPTAPAPATPTAPKEKPAVAEPKAEQPATPAVSAAEPAAPAKPQQPVAADKAPESKEENAQDEVIKARSIKLTGPNIIGKIELPVERKSQPVASSSDSEAARRKRKRKKTGPGQAGTEGQQAGANASRHDQRSGDRQHHGKGQHHKGGKHQAVAKEEPSEKEIQDQIKATLARLSGAGKSGKFAQRAKLRRQKRDDVAHSAEEAALEEELQSKILKVTEFVTANELANMMDVPVTKVIGTCMSLGMFVSINQRLDAETLSIVADEFGFEVQFVKPDEEEELNLEEEDLEEDLLPRVPVVTIMGHVDHGKTSLLDYIRKANVVAGEAGGITQHIGAYKVTTNSGKEITFLDTPGHEAFTAMRARGAKVADIAIIVIAADDAVMPQTKEAINHAQAANVPIVFAFTKVDKPSANSDRVREQLSVMNILVEDWGGKYQSQEISSKSGLNVDLLLDKVLLEAEMLDLKANPNKRATGTVIEATLDKGRGIVTTVLVQGGTLKVGDPILAGSYSGKVKALFNERGAKVQQAGPSVPVQVLGMQGAPTAGDRFNVLASEAEARDIANKRMQLLREQGLRTQKHITLDEIGRRLAIGNFKELNIIIKGDVDGSIEALADSLLKLSTAEIQINIISKAVGQISESDVLLASASDAIILGFQVRPSAGARKLAEQEQIDIRLYSIIYDAINEIKTAMEGMLAPEFEEKIVANVEIRETFKISKVGTIAGCMVLDGKISRNSKIRIIREGVVIYTGELASLKRFKDDVKEVSKGYECGLNIQNFNNIEVGDIVEAYEQVEVKRKL